jgi:trimeric autotransporter adhesin
MSQLKLKKCPVVNSNTTGFQNTAIGLEALRSNTLGPSNTASGFDALFSNTTGGSNTASGAFALSNNTTGSSNTAIGVAANVAAGDLTNATAIGAGAVVDASNKIRLGNDAVTVIEGQVALTSVSDKTKKENFQPVDGEAVLGKIRGLALSSWNFIGHDPQQFRHYGPMAQDFFAAFGHDGVGQIGSETTINAGDMAGILMSAVQALEQRTAELKQKEAQMAVLASKLAAVAARLEALEAAAARAATLASR